MGRSDACWAWLKRNRTAVAIVLVAFGIRWVVNGVLHRPGDYLTSDMGGYFQRASSVLSDPWDPSPSRTFFPWGTHVLLAGLQWLCGSAIHGGLALGNALLGAASVAYAIGTARRLLADDTGVARFVPNLCGGALALDPAAIGLGSFVLSENPFALAVTAAAYYAVAWFERPGVKRAAALGSAFALGAAIRPQMFVALGLLSLAICFWRGLRRRVRWRDALALGAPLLLVIAFSALRFHHHTGRLGVVSSNGAFNFALGRCHALSLEAKHTRFSHFEPPSFTRLARAEQSGRLEPVFRLDPALGEHLVLDSTLWDEAAARDLAARCVAASGFQKQLKYSATHVLLLWAYNFPWPLRGSWGLWATIWPVVFLPGFVAQLGHVLRRPPQKSWLLAVHPLGLLLTSVVFWGETRLRVPYDGVIVVLALSRYAHWGSVAYAHWQARKLKATALG